MQPEGFLIVQHHGHQPHHPEHRQQNGDLFQHRIPPLHLGQGAEKPGQAVGKKPGHRINVT